MTFYGKYFGGLLGTRRKKIAAYSTSHENFSMPTLIGRNKHVLLLIECASLRSCERIIKVIKEAAKNFWRKFFRRLPLAP